jgi:hypothetical protein
MEAADSERLGDWPKVTQLMARWSRSQTPHTLVAAFLWIYNFRNVLSSFVANLHLAMAFSIWALGFSICSPYLLSSINDL